MSLLYTFFRFRNENSWVMYRRLLHVSRRKQSPITALYQAFSKKEQNKRWVAEQEYKDDQRRIVKELLRTYVAYKVIELTEEEFDEFISFMNLNEAFLKTASEMDLITFIQDKFEHYMYMRGH